MSHTSTHPPAAGQPDSSRATPAPADIWASRQPGAYLLLLHLPADATLTPGRLGQIAFPAGWYLYIGSALGGLGARLRRHARVEKRHHWHIDTLRAACRLVAVAVRTGPERIECQTAATIAALPGATRPAPRFGASDCRCPAHLLHFQTEPDLHLDDDWHVSACHDKEP